MNFTPIDNNGTVEGFCIIKSADKKTSSKGDFYLDIILGDSDGEINAKLWRYSKELHGEFAANEIVKVRGTISEYNGADQLRIDRIRHITENDGVDPADFVKSADYSGEQMFGELLSIAENFADNDLRLIVSTILKDNRKALLYWPAAYKLHHAIRGGLLLHTLSVVRLAERVCEIYTFVDKELLISGAILHDIAKIQEYDVTDSGIATGYSVEGNLLGHLTMGAMTIDRYAESLGISKDTATLLKHMCISHHGEPEFGAAVRPMFIEAELLSELDLMDARVYIMRDAVKTTEENDFSGKIWAMESRKMFNHGRKDINSELKLF